MPTVGPEAPAATAALGDLTFDLAGAELRRRAMARLEAARGRLTQLVSAPGPRSVEGLLVPLNAVLAGARDVGSHGSLIFSVHTDAATRTVGREVSEAADAFFHAFRLDTPAYDALRGLDLSGEDAETRFAVEKLLREMRRAGVERDAASRERLLELNRKIDLVTNRFAENIATHERSIELDSPHELAGLPPDFREAHPADPSGRVRLTTRYPDFLPVMAYAERPDVRRRLLHEFANRAYPENLTVLAELLGLRYAFARELGYPDYATYAVEDKMVATPTAVRELFTRLDRRLRAPARADVRRYLARKRRDVPGAKTLEPWEAQFFGSGYYDQKIRDEEFGVDMRRLRRFLPYGRVRDGLFDLCRELFGIAFVRSPDPAWAPGVEVYDVARRGEPLGRIYLDLVPREGKYNHAACFPVREGIEGLQLPQAALICNFVAPGPTPETTRLEYTEVVTFFHEFGHLLHSLLSGRQRWLYNSQMNLEWDFIEAPSQLFEEWARDPATLRRFARDPDSGRPIPRDLVERLKAAATLGRSLGWLRQVALASVSLDLYTGDPAGRDLSAATRESFARYAPGPMPSDYHFETAFGHLTGYSAFYYTYAWSAVIARDLLSPFFAAGDLTDPPAADRYAREILAPGSRRPAADLIRRYLGREFRFAAFEAWATAKARAPARRRARRSPGRVAPSKGRRPPRRRQRSRRPARRTRRARR